MNWTIQIKKVLKASQRVLMTADALWMRVIDDIL